MRSYTIIFLVLFSLSTQAQVGIGTTTPGAVLEVNGNVRIKNLPAATTAETINLGGVSTENKLNATTIGSNLLITNTGLGTAPVARKIGRRVITPDDYDTATTIKTLDLFIGGTDNQDGDSQGGDGQEQYNEDATFIYVTGHTGTTKIAGIIGGTEGRRMTIYFGESSNVTLLEQSNSAGAGNKIITLAVAGINTSGVGLAELVYDDDAISNGEGAWLVLKFRD